MIPFILAAVGGYLIGDSMKSKKFAKGGMTEHGLKSGDKIIDRTYFDENTINVINDGKYAAVNLDKGERMEGIYANGGEIEKAAKFRADNPNWTNEKILAEYNDYKFKLSEFNAGNIKPSKVIGGGYKSSATARKLAKQWLEDRVAENKMALEIRGVMADGGVMSRGGESHSDQMIDIMNRDREQEMSRRMKFQESTLQEDMEEAREIFGKYWDTLTEKEKIEATKYLKIKGEVGHFGREDDDVQTFMNDLNYKRGGRTNE